MTVPEWQVALAVADNCADYDVVAITNHAHRLFLQCDSKGSLVVRSVRVCPRYVSSPYPDAGLTLCDDEDDDDVIRPLDDHDSAYLERERLKPFYSKGQSPQEVRTAILRDGTMVASDLRDSVCISTLSQFVPHSFHAFVTSDFDQDADTLLCLTTRPNASESTPSDSRESSTYSPIVTILSP